MLTGFMLKGTMLKGKEMKAFCLSATALIFFWAFFWSIFFMPVHATVNDAGFVYTVESRAANVGELLAEQGINVAFHDKVYPGIYAPITEGIEITIERTVPYVLSQPETTATYYTTASTVKEALEEMGIPVNNGSYFISPLLEDPIYSAMEITLVHRRVVTEFTEEKIQYEIESKEDRELQKGRHLIVKEGTLGLRELEYIVVYAGDEVYSRELVQERIVKEPETALVHIGTKEDRPPVISGMIASRGDRIGDYSSEGIASWYGNEFHGRKTSNGEIYDQYSLTAAHRSLPFGTVVRVTSLDTGKSVVVTINNRGPFIEGRIIDLSRGAAQAIGLESQGIGMVRIETIWEEAVMRAETSETSEAAAASEAVAAAEVVAVAEVAAAALETTATPVAIEAPTALQGEIISHETAVQEIVASAADETSPKKSAAADIAPSAAEIMLPEILPEPMTESTYYEP